MESVKRIKTDESISTENWESVKIKSEPLDYEIIETHNPAKLDCKLCKKDFDTQSKLFSHLKDHFSTEEEVDKNQCKYCMLKFSTRKLWISHVNKHYMHNIKSYKCLECPIITDTPENLVNHYRIGNHSEENNVQIKREHPGNEDNDPVARSILSILDWSSLEVTIDDVKYEDIVNFNNLPVNRHMRFQCSFCSIIFRARDKYLSHLRRHIEVKDYLNAKMTIFKCLKCEEIFEEADELANHSKSHIQKVHKNHNEICKYCSRTFFGRAEWISHVNQHYIHVQNTFKCLECEFTSSEPEKLVQHYEIHKNMDLASLNLESEESGCSKICKICEKTFLTESGCRNHYSSVHRNFHQCYSCNEIFNSKKTLVRHQILTHDQYFPCEHCQRVYKTLLSLQLHREEVHEISLFECIFCDEVVFGSRQNLLLHQEQIHRLSKYVCFYCFECFTSFNALNIHETLHACDDGTEESSMEQDFELLTPQIEMKEDEGKVQLSDEN